MNQSRSWAPQLQCLVASRWPWMLCAYNNKTKYFLDIGRKNVKFTQFLFYFKCIYIDILLVSLGWLGPHLRHRYRK